MPDTDRDKLARHLGPLNIGRDRPWNFRVADAILADPQAHIDALVGAGVLEDWGHDILGEGGKPLYAVVPPKPPHEHDWRIININRGSKKPFRVSCVEGCGREFWAGPANWPKYEGEVPS